MTAPFTMSGTRRVLDLDAFDDTAGYARVNGREIAVHHLDAIAYRALEAIRANPENIDFTALYDAVERACPDLTRDEIDKLSGKKIGLLIGVAENGIQQVQAQLPNAEGPTETTTTIDPSPPA